MADKYRRFVDADTEIDLNEADAVTNNDVIMYGNDENMDDDVSGDVGEPSRARDDIGPVNSRLEEDMSAYSATYHKLDNNNDVEKVEISETQIERGDDGTEPISGSGYVGDAIRWGEEGVTMWQGHVHWVASGASGVTFVVRSNNETSDVTYYVTSVSYMTATGCVIQLYCVTTWVSLLCISMICQIYFIIVK